MSELDNLRPEVREAMDEMDRIARIVPAQCGDELRIIRTELLRLMDEYAAIKAQSIYPRAQLLGNLADANERAEKAEAELAAIKAATCEWRHDLDEDTWDSACGARWMFDEGGPEENDVRFCQGCGKRVRLVVDDPPGKTSDQ